MAKGDDVTQFLRELILMWDEGKFDAVVMALAGHEQSTVARFARDLDDYDRGGGVKGRAMRHVDTFIRLLEERGR